ncbi:hypothetical protein EUTSA_v10021860mg [Eutrema salsugineum]|uniref:Uncharacterized protein n=1 Tax=Eutrema salsugineum TaxID=72664 RepID=V4M2H7_EUTSA|nr:hypothetical protein EUTSA_v10021860mg [Eutrema salsugineum]
MEPNLNGCLFNSNFGGSDRKTGHESMAVMNNIHTYFFEISFKSDHKNNCGVYSSSLSTNSLSNSKSTISFTSSLRLSDEVD